MEDLEQGQSYFTKKPLIITPKADTFKSSRLNALDLQRGFIMCLMAFSHCREYVSTSESKYMHWNNPVTGQELSALDFTQKTLINLVAAGGFYMMMGIGIFFLWQSRIKEGVKPEVIRNYLFYRGFILILVQFSILAFFETFTHGEFYLYIGVLFSLGICMMMASWTLYGIELIKTKNKSGLSKIEYWIPALLSLGIILITHLVIWSDRYFNIVPGITQMALLLGGDYNTPLLDIDINFTPFPWFPSVALGLVIGKILTDKKDKASTILSALAVAFLLAWFLIRTANLQGLFMFGDFKLISPDAEPLTWQTYMNISKFPPSLTYFLWSWSINLLGIVWWFKLEQNQPRLFSYFKPLKVFGQTALFFFILHWFVYYGLSLILTENLTSVTSLVSAWLIGLLILFPLCKKWRQFKSQTDKNSTWRMF